MKLGSLNVYVIDTFENERPEIEERTEVGSPKLVYNGSDDKYQPIMSSEFQFNLSVPTAEDGKFLHLFTGNERRYQVVLKNQDDVVFWRGHLLPDFYSEPYKNGVLFVELTAIDGLGALKGHYLDDQYYKGEFSVMILIAECLKKTGLSQNIIYAPAIQPQAVDYRWDEIWIDGTSFLDDNNDKTKEWIAGTWWNVKKPKRKTAYDILESLMETLGCTVFTYDERWYIEGINRKHESNQVIENYTTDGIFVNSVLRTKNSSEVVFLKTPIVSIVSPWSAVNIDWGIDENPNLLPEDIITHRGFVLDTSNPFINGGVKPEDPPLKHWKAVGGVDSSVGSREGKTITDWRVPGSIPVELQMTPYNYAVGMVYTSWNPWKQTGETSVGTNYNWTELRNPKYLKVSDDYMSRTIAFEFEVYARGGSKELIDKDLLEKTFRFDLYVGDKIIVSNRPGQPSEVSVKFDLSFSDESLKTVGDSPTGNNIFIKTVARITAKIAMESMALPKNGYLNFKFFGPVSTNPEKPYFFSYVFTNLKLTYTAQNEWQDSLVRNIDYTTTKDVSMFFGDSIQDLSKLQFRFRRYNEPEMGNNYKIEILDRKYYPGNGSWELSRFVFFISDFHAKLIQDNKSLLTVNYNGLDIAIDSLYGNDAQGLWGVHYEEGGCYMSMIVPLKNENRHKIFDDIENFQLLFVNVEGSDPGGWVKEDNEWRESWRRYGKKENIRYGLALGKVYHDVQPEPIVKIEGDVIGIYNPTELFNFFWTNQKEFLPIRLTLDYSNAVTNVTMIETKIEDINDYIL